jgi:hypothetical protein
MKKTKYTKKRYTKYTKKRYTKNNKKTRINKIKRKIGGANNNTDKDIKKISYINNKISVEFTDTFKPRENYIYQINIEGIIINLTLRAGMIVYDTIKPDKIKEICSKKNSTDNSAFKMSVNILSNKRDIYKIIQISPTISGPPTVNLIRECREILEPVAAARARAAAAAAAAAVARARALPAALPAAEVANVKVEIEDRAGDFLKKVNEHNDYCTELNSEYEKKHKELGTIMGYLREILKEMPEIKAGDRIIYEIIHSLDFLSFGYKLNLKTMRNEQDAWIAQAAANSNKILSSLRKYKELQKDNNTSRGRPAPPAPGTPAPIAPIGPIRHPSPFAPPAPAPSAAIPPPYSNPVAARSPPPRLTDDEIEGKTDKQIIEMWIEKGGISTYRKIAVEHAKKYGESIKPEGVTLLTYFNKDMSDEGKEKKIKEYIIAHDSVGGRNLCDGTGKGNKVGNDLSPIQWGRPSLYCFNR